MKRLLFVFSALAATAPAAVPALATAPGRNGPIVYSRVNPDGTGRAEAPAPAANRGPPA